MIAFVRALTLACAVARANPPYHSLNSSIDLLPLTPKVMKVLRKHTRGTIRSLRDDLGGALVRGIYPFSRTQGRTLRTLIRGWDACESILSSAELDFGDALYARMLSYRARNLIADHDVRTFEGLATVVREITTRDPAPKDRDLADALKQLSRFAADGAAAAAPTSPGAADE